jgi:ABC-type branched-subunit amino acid transport system substrate-binding protein
VPAPFSLRQISFGALLFIAILALASCGSAGSTNVQQGTDDGKSALSQPSDAAGSDIDSSMMADPFLDDLDGYTNLATPPIEGDKVRVALLLPLSGRLEQLGQAMLNAAELALFDTADNRFELLPYDTEGNPETAAFVAGRAIRDGASLIIGPLLADSVRSVAAETLIFDIPVLAFSSDRTVAGGGAYVMGFTPGTEVDHVVSHAARNGLSRIAAMAPNSRDGMIVRDELRKAAAAQGLTVTHIELFDPRVHDFTEPVQRLVNASMQHPASIGADFPMDALLLAEGGQTLTVLTAFLLLNEIDPQEVQLLGLGAWDDPTLGTEAALVGGRFAAPDPRFRGRFEARYFSTFGAPPPRLTTLAYDAVALAASMAQDGSPIPFSREKLTDPEGFFGRDGLFRFRLDGTPERSLAIQEIGSGGNQIIEESYDRFPGSS